jgi:hypothetical protein
VTVSILSWAKAPLAANTNTAKLAAVGPNTARTDGAREKSDVMEKFSPYIPRPAMTAAGFFAAGLPATCFGLEDYPVSPLSQRLAYVFMQTLCPEYECLLQFCPTHRKACPVRIRGGFSRPSIC